MTEKTIRELAECLVQLGMVAHDKADSVLEGCENYADEGLPAAELVESLVEFGVAFSVHGEDVDSVEHYYRDLLQEVVGPLTGVAFSDVVLVRDEDGPEVLHFANGGKAVWWGVEHRSGDYADKMAFLENIDDLNPGAEDPRRFFPYSPEEVDTCDDDFYVLATRDQALALREEFGIDFDGLAEEHDEPPAAPFLDTWLAQRDSALAEWRGRFLPVDFPFDFSLDSLDALEPLVLDRYPDSKAVREEDAFVAGAVRYIGESLIKNAPCHWEYWAHGDTIYSHVPLVSGDVPSGFPATAVPLHELAALAAKRVPGTLRRKAEQLRAAADQYDRARNALETHRNA